jgi:hypothetical protein
MASGTQGDQVQVVIRALLAAQLLVMDLQVFPGTTYLTLPAITPQNLFLELVVWFGIKPQSWSFGSNPSHEAFPFIS